MLPGQPKPVGPHGSKPTIQRRVSKYDGQTIWVDGSPAYEMGNFLGSGVAGSYVLFSFCLFSCRAALPHPYDTATCAERVFLALCLFLTHRALFSVLHGVVSTQRARSH